MKQSGHVKTLQLLHRSDANYSVMGIQRQTEEFQTQSKVTVAQCFPSHHCQYSMAAAICLLLGSLDEAAVLIAEPKGRILARRDILVYNPSSKAKG